MKKIFVLCFILNISAFAQTSEQTAAQLYDIAALSGELNQVINQAPKDCFTPLSPIELKSEITCTQDESEEHQELKKEDYQSYIVEIDKYEDLPDELKAHIPGQAFEQGQGGLKIMLALPNDNKALGLWGVIGKETADDFGDTHGAKISISTTDKNLIRYTLNGETNLYTIKLGNSFKEGDQKFYNQNFTNETMARFVVDNILKNKTTYFKAGVGWIKLDSEKSKGFFRASGQQNSWHDLLGIYKFKNIADGEGIKNGVNLDAFFGVQKNIILGSTCRIRTFAETGGNISTLNDDYFKVGAGATLYFQKPGKKSTFTLGSEGDLKLHEDGVQKQFNVSAGWSSNRFGAEFIYHQKFTDLRNHVNYNMANSNGQVDPTMTISLTYNIDGIKIFGKASKKKK